MSDTPPPIPVPDFSGGHFFETVCALSDRIVGLGSTYLLALTAMTLGLDVTFYRTQRAGGMSMKGAPTKVPGPLIYRISDGRKSVPFFTSNSNRLLTFSYHLEAKDKSRTKAMLHKAGLATPFGGAAKAANPNILNHFAKAGIRRVIVKPVQGSRGGGILFDVTLEEAHAHMSLNPKDVFLVEQIVKGTERRIMSLDDRILAAYVRLPVRVEGDGKSTLADLVAAKVAAQQINAFSAPRAKDPAAHLAFLESKGRVPTNTPAKGEIIPLEDREYGSPADVIDCSEALPGRVAEAALKAVSVLGGRFCGADIMELPDGEPYFLELNAKPGIARHCFPLNGPQNLDVPEALVRHHFPKLRADYRRPERFEFLELRKDFNRLPDRQVFEARDYTTFA